MSTYGHICNSIANSDQFCRRASDPMVKHIKYERLSPHQGRSEKPQSSISGYGLYGTLGRDCTNLTESGI